MARREELTRFLKAARARISPSEVGLPPCTRRRAQGLRREEVASLTGMSVSWYTWFEQGRDVQLSAHMLERLSRTLRLNSDEREFLFALAQGRPPPLACGREDEVGPEVQQLLDYINIPAMLMLPDWTVIAWNRLTARLLRDWGALPPADRNLFKILLLDEQYRQNEAMFRQEARRCIARFKWDYSRAVDLGSFEAIIAEMNEISDVFREYWPDSTVRSCYDSVNAEFREDIGWIAFRQTSFTLEQSPTQRLVLFTPFEDESAEKLERVRCEPDTEIAAPGAPEPVRSARGRSRSTGTA
ncbi:MAG: helix-turn-helix transcriptional regulator [Sphingomonadales bacterium]